MAQNSEDEPARELLAKIIAKKNTLLKEKVIQKGKKIDPISREEIYSEIPDSWEWIRLQVVGNVFNGNSINARVKNEKYSGKKDGIPFIATKDVEYGFTALNYENGVKIPLDEPKFKIAHRGSVLICAEGGSAGKKCGITTQDIYFGNKLFALEPFAGIESKFLLSLYLSPLFFAQFQKRMTGIIGGISLANFSAIPIPLPPLAEQKRIVAKVDQLMALCDRLEAQQQERSMIVKQSRISALDALADARDVEALLTAWKRVQGHLPKLFDHPDDVEDLKKCILQNAVMGKMVSEPGMMVKKLEDVISYGPKNGLSPQGVDYETETKVFTLSATTKGVIDLSKYKNVEANIEEESHLWLDDGDVLIQRGNSKEYVGISSV